MDRHGPCVTAGGARALPLGKWATSLYRDTNIHRGAAVLTPAGAMASFEKTHQRLTCCNRCIMDSGQCYSSVTRINACTRSDVIVKHASHSAAMKMSPTAQNLRQLHSVRNPPSSSSSDLLAGTNTAALGSGVLVEDVRARAAVPGR